MRTWTVGDFKISEIHELPAELGLFDGLIPEAPREVVQTIDWMSPDYANEAGQILADLHCYVVDTGDQKILVDAGCGNGKSYPTQPVWSNLDTAFLERLSEAGYERDDIDLILLTHVHLDHVGWCAVQDETGAWVPTFPNARLVVVDAEWQRHLDLMLPDGGDAIAESATGADDGEVDVIARAFYADAETFSNQAKLVQKESLQPVVDAGLLELVPSGAEVAPGVRYESTPGHTSAHHSVRLESGGEQAFITGDFIHHPMQIARPEWSSAGDFDPEMSGRTRRAFFEASAGTDLLVLGTHFTGSGAGYIVEDGDNYRLVQERPA
ncbi:MBL fold metallo-hydrolase [Aeromicrobium endophyticum]|nr:MBL fold metallo-hydrolase [Aeromicrobium endophyticum]